MVIRRPTPRSWVDSFVIAVGVPVQAGRGRAVSGSFPVASILP